VKADGRVIFGESQRGSKLFVIIPVFVNNGIKPLDEIRRKIDNSTRLRRENSREELLKKALGGNSRVVIENHQITPLDQEAARMLYEMGLPTLKHEHISI
jgi:hypothetical protein